MNDGKSWGVSANSQTIIKEFDAFGETNIIIGSASGYPNSGVFPGDDDAIKHARLMAAAPDLLEALLAVVSVADRATAEFDKARSAVKKATGA
jgi:hypothetical protein